MNCFVAAGLCSKDYIGVEVALPKGNKNAAMLRIDAAIFDRTDWFTHYKALHAKKDDSKWDELNWLKEHLFQFGARYPTRELMERATGRPLDSCYYMEYLRKKYSEVYKTQL